MRHPPELFTLHTQVSLKMYLILIIIGLTATASADCPTECYCVEKETTTCIGDKELTTFPGLGLISAIKRLEVRDYFLSNLGLETRTPFGLIKELSVSHNQIQKFYTRPSAGLRLTLLDLSFNNLTDFTAGKELGSLKILDLSHNRIERIRLEWLDKLESLNLRSNSIEELSEDAFQPLKSVHYINLDSNRLKNLSPNLFSNLRALAHLILSSNPLDLDHGFLFNSRTQFIDVSNVGLEFVPPSLTKTVRDLRLNNNKLKRILESDFESYPIVGLLVLDENQIESIEDDAMGRLDFLTSLWLNGNRLTSLPQNLPSSLKSLQVEENLITTLNATDFSRLKNLETLFLHGNQISFLEPGVFSPLVSLRTLSLRSNQIDSILPASFSNLSCLQSLDLSQNPLKVIVNGAFVHFESLLTLQLSHLTEVDISFAVSVFQPLRDLQTLNLRSSAVVAQKLVRGGGLGYFKSLQELNVERCELGVGDLPLLCADLDVGLSVLKAGGNPFNSTATISQGVEDGAGTVNSFQILCPTAVRALSRASDESGSENRTSSPEKVSLALTTTTMDPAAGTETVSTATQRGKMEMWVMITTTTTPAPAPTSTSSYFELKSKSSVSTNEDVHIGQGHSRRTSKESPNEDDGGGGEELPERGSIDGFPVDLSGRTTPKSRAQEHDDDFAKGSFHRLPPRMHLKSDGRESTGDSNGSRGLILKTILISAGTCTLCILILLLLGLIFFRLNGGRFVRRRRNGSEERTEGPNTLKSYKRLEEKQQELELGISNRMYFEDGQVYHIS